MRQWVKCVFAAVAIGVGGWMMSENAHASSEPLWQYGGFLRQSEIADDRYIGETYPCGGKEGVIILEPTRESLKACVFGDFDTVRIARYTTDQGVLAYAIAFPNDTQYKHVNGLCSGLPQCVYGQAGDTFLIQDGASYPHYHAVVKDFTKYLIPEPSDNSKYRFHHPGFLTYLKRGTYRLITGNAAVSDNGKWIVIELPEYGIVRMNTVSGDVKRIVGRGSIPPIAGEITSFTITDDGRWVATVGYREGVFIYEVNDTCGDVLTGFSSTNFMGDTVPCREVVILPNQHFQSTQLLFAPRFSSDSRQLMVYRRAGTPTRITFAQNSMTFLNPYYVAFGDSFTSGEGELEDRFYLPETNTSSNRCHVSTRSYPYILETHWDVAAKNFACSGSRMEDVRQAIQKFDSTNTKHANIATLSIGGNDADFMGKLKTCISPGTCEWAQEKYRKATALEIKNLLPRFVDLMNELKQSHGGAQRFVIGYPNIINAQPQAHCSPLMGVLFTADERRYMSESISYLNKVLKAAAHHAGLPFVDIEDSYGNERLCDSEATAMNELRYGDDIAPIPFLEETKLIGAESFHPTPRGHFLAARVIQESIAAHNDAPPCTTCTFEESDLALSSYWLEGEAPEPPRLISNKFLNKEAFQGFPEAFYTFLKRTFTPHSIITIELHSDVREIGQAVAAEDGSLTGTLQMPLDTEGYHTVHVLGTSYTGEPIDIYQTVFISAESEKMTGEGTSIPADPPPNRHIHSEPGVHRSVTKTAGEGEGSGIANEAPIKIASTEETPAVKGHQISNAPPPKEATLSTKTSPWYSWLGLAVILGSASFLLWWIFFKKPKL